MRPALAMSLLIAMFGQPSLSQSGSAGLTANQDREAKELEQQWKELREKDPLAWDKQKALIALEAQQSLAKFGYGTVFTADLDDRTKQAVREYQSRSGLLPTGDLDARTHLHLLEDDIALGQEIPIGPPYTFHDSLWSTFFTAGGVWVAQGREPDLTTPVRPTRIECSKTTRTCIAATFTGTQINLVTFDLERWDQFEIVTRPYDLPCGRETVRISRNDKTVLSINTAAYKDVEACTQLFGPPGKPAVSRLDDAMKIREVRLKALQSAQRRIKLIPPEAKSRTGLP